MVLKVLDGNYSQEYTANAGVSWSYTFLLYVNDISDDVICDIVIYADDTALEV